MHPDQRQLTLECPGCKVSLVWRTDNPWRPFCSEQCRNRDFVGWANEQHVIGGSSLYDDILSGELEPGDTQRD